MSLGLDLPKQVFGHPWLIVEGGKMSKSLGNVVYADDLVAKYGVDAVRYYFLHEIPYASDGLFTEKLLVERINSDLVNVLGNLVNRTITMAYKYFDGVIDCKRESEEIDKDFEKVIDTLNENVAKKMDELMVGDALEEIFKLAL